MTNTHTTQPPTPRERRTVEQFEAMVRAQGEAQARQHPCDGRQGARMICTVCGREHRGQMREGFTGPDQRFVTQTEYDRRRPIPRLVDDARHRAEREAARLAAVERGKVKRAARGDWWIL